ncbi:TetR family transcriptional regulator [Murinocardiopsis flavida]|uniref:TetR family transcriptional regulator n=1 Tax=Murinocardiopsis flavida TaxID=645275 RepID=A0A2P8CVE6_9ACTN|nr:TetR/AcrR family transcriptional regulator [Murinocardiopsis flavida]PSK88951.1 TetR family transcriptional regulator [Murinocardiopsis flavida]
MPSDALTRTRRARRDDLVAAAIRLIHRDGVHAASVERIAAEAGTSKGTALYHFANKEELYGSVVDTLFEAGRAYMGERLQAATTPRERLAIYVESNLRFVLENGEHVVATQRILEQIGVGDADPSIPPLRAMLEDGQREGVFVAFDSEVMAIAIRALIDTAAYHLPGRAGGDGEHYVAEAAALVLRAVGAAPPDAR